MVVTHPSPFALLASRSRLDAPCFGHLKKDAGSAARQIGFPKDFKSNVTKRVRGVIDVEVWNSMQEERVVVERNPH